MASRFDDIDQRLKSLETTSEVFSTKTYNPEELNDRTRARIALVFVFGYFSLAAATVVVSMIYNAIMCHGIIDPDVCAKMGVNVKDMLLAVMGIAGSPLGFVLGYYFKDKFDK